MCYLDHKESWAPKDRCFQTVVPERLLRVSWIAMRSNQSILKEINPEYSLEGLMLWMKLQNFGHLKWWTDSLDKTLMLIKIEGRRSRGWQDEMVAFIPVTHRFKGGPWEITLILLSGESHRQRCLGELQPIGLQRAGHDWSDFAGTNQSLPLSTNCSIYKPRNYSWFLSLFTP